VKTILFLTPRFPWPLIGGDRIKSYNMIKHLARNHRVILVTFHHGSLPSVEQRRAIESLGVELHAVALHPLRAGLACFRTFWTGLPLEIAFYTRPDFKRIVDELIATEQIDVAVSFFMRTAEYIRSKRGLMKILVAEDCRLEYQTRSLHACRTVLQKLVRWWETKKLAAYEPAVAMDFDTTTFVTKEDIDAMRRQQPRGVYALLTNGVDLDRFSFDDRCSHRSGLLFTGKLDVQANHLMASGILHTILPRIRQQMPEVTLSFVGANPRKSLQASAKDGAYVVSNVPDIVPYLHGAAVFLHPHEGGSGIQNKVLEAMAAGCPVVTTPSGLQGIEAVHGVHAMIGTSHEELAEHTVQLLRNPELRMMLARNARVLMEETHSWEHVHAQIDGVLGLRPPAIIHHLHTAAANEPLSARV
jgi:polysaccharide biosynthesis protein PslH